jgi:uncharacterized membrane protein YdjX (TVP38/TMEM64 family)
LSFPGIPMIKSPWLKLAALIAVLFAGVLGLRLAGVDVTRLSPDRVRSFVLSFGFWAPAIYLVAWAQPLVPLPGSIMALGAGLAFGPWWGSLAFYVSGLIRAVLQFLIARLCGREAVCRILHGRVAAMDAKLGSHGFQTVLILRLIPNLPFDMQNYGFGCSSVAFAPYAAATALAMVPATVLVTSLGHGLAEPRELWKPLLVAVLLYGAVFWHRRRHQQARKVAP